MPAYHSKFDAEAGLIANFPVACGMCLLPIKTTARGPPTVPAAPEGEDDILDEALFFFRANVLFRNFDVRTSVDRTLILATLTIQLALKEAEKIDSKAEATKALGQVALKAFTIPGDQGFALQGLFPPPADAAERENFRVYFRMLREETMKRVVEKLFNADGTKNKWWQPFSRRKFMNRELTR